MNRFEGAEWFTENVRCLDITKRYIYVLLLVGDRYYVGKTGNILRRLDEHFNNNGSIYTKEYKPIKIIEIQEETNDVSEKTKTIEYMTKYGWEKVRGYSWCSLRLRKKPNFVSLKPTNINKNVMFIEYEDDNELIRLYNEECKNIIEIGELLNRTPGSVAFRLEKLGIICRKELARGFFDYTFSDMYKMNIIPKVKQKPEYVVNTLAKELKDRIRNKLNNINNENTAALS
jgi:predicted GIY-YIG superfamily endonuclease